MGRVGAVVPSIADVLLHVFAPQLPNSACFSGCHTGCVLSTANWMANMKAIRCNDGFDLLEWFDEFDWWRKSAA